MEIFTYLQDSCSPFALLTLQLIFSALSFGWGVDSMGILALIIGAIITICFMPEVVINLIIHPFKSLFYAIRDTFFFFVDRKYNEPNAGRLTAITGYFGKGKTLTGVKLALDYEKRYNGKKWYDRKAKIWRTNRVVILSNCRINCKNFVYLSSLNQIVSLAYSSYDLEHVSRETNTVQSETCTTIFTLLDEAGAKMSSRSFKTNIDPDFLSTILTCRKFHLNFYYTTQRFNLTDKLLRDVTLDVINVRKTFRSCMLSYFDAWEMENSNNPTLVKPRSYKFYFASNTLFKAYDTLATVDDLKRDCDRNDRMTAVEILSLRIGNSDIDNVSSPSHKLRKMRK